MASSLGFCLVKPLCRGNTKVLSSVIPLQPQGQQVAAILPSVVHRSSTPKLSLPAVTPGLSTHSEAGLWGSRT